MSFVFLAHHEVQKPRCASDVPFDASCLRLNILHDLTLTLLFGLTMTRLAILADIHANLFALDAVIDDLKTREVDEVIVAGDLVGRGPQGSAVVERIWEQGWSCVKGNHEEYLINFWRRNIPPEWYDQEHWSGARWMSEELGQEHIEYLEALPFSLTPKTCPDVFIVHGSTRSNQEGIGSWTDPEVLSEIFELVPTTHNLLVCAHTHRPLDLEVQRGQRVVNVGSVGLPFNGDNRAQYVILEPQDDGVYNVEFIQVEYDRQELLDHYASSGFLEKGGITSAMLRHEVLHAKPFLVPFLRWCEGHQVDPTSERIPWFLEAYDHTKSLKELVEQLEASVRAINTNDA